jgi:hypothetical protein
VHLGAVRVSHSRVMSQASLPGADAKSEGARQGYRSITPGARWPDGTKAETPAGASRRTRAPRTPRARPWRVAQRLIRRQGLSHAGGTRRFHLWLAHGWWGPVRRRDVHAEVLLRPATLAGALAREEWLRNVAGGTWVTRSCSEGPQVRVPKGCAACTRVSALVCLLAASSPAAGLLDSVVIASGPSYRFKEVLHSRFNNAG